MILRLLIIAAILFAAWFFLNTQIQLAKAVLHQTFEWMYHR